MWQIHSGSLFAAAMELWVASRTDGDVRTHIVALERDVVRTITSDGGDARRREGERA
jgi:hypothetical protein